MYGIQIHSMIHAATWAHRRRAEVDVETDLRVVDRELLDGGSHARHGGATRSGSRGPGWRSGPRDRERGREDPRSPCTRRPPPGVASRARVREHAGRDEGGHRSGPTRAQAGIRVGAGDARFTRAWSHRCERGPRGPTCGSSCRNTAWLVLAPLPRPHARAVVGRHSRRTVALDERRRTSDDDDPGGNGHLGGRGPRGRGRGTPGARARCRAPGPVRGPNGADRAVVDPDRAADPVAHLKRLASRFPGVATTTRIEDGDPASLIVDVAEEVGRDDRARQPRRARLAVAVRACPTSCSARAVQRVHRGHEEGAVVPLGPIAQEARAPPSPGGARRAPPSGRACGTGS